MDLLWGGGRWGYLVSLGNECGVSMIRWHACGKDRWDGTLYPRPIDGMIQSIARPIGAVGKKPEMSQMVQTLPYGINGLRTV